MVEEKGSKLESEGEQPKDERQFDQEQYDRHGLTRANTDEHGRWWNLSIKNIAGNFPLPHGRGLVEDCWGVVPRVSAWRPAPAAMDIEPYGF